MDKNTTAAFILIGAILVVWLFMNTPNQKQQAANAADTTQVVSNDTSKQVQKSEKETAQKTSNKEILHQKKPVVSDTANLGKYFSYYHQPEKIITIENSLVKLEMTTRGGDIKKYFLKKYKNWFSADDDSSAKFYTTHVQLINYPLGGGGPDLDFVTTDGKAISTADLDFNTDADKAYYDVKKGDSLSISFTLKVNDGKYIRKTYTFYGDKYSMSCKLDLSGMNNVISNNDFDLLWKKGVRFVEENSVDEASYANASVFYGGDHVVVSASKGDSVEKNFPGAVSWIAARDKYFAAIIAPQKANDVDGAYIQGKAIPYGSTGERSYYNIRLIVPLGNSDFETKNFTLYLGPADYNILKQYGHHMEAIVEFGSIFGIKFLVQPIAEYVLLPLFNMLHVFIPNYGLVIIIFSLIIKFVLYPLTKSSYQSMKKMQLLQPKITEMKERLKDDPQKMNKEMMKLYSTYGVNPAGGCLPLVLQMPIFIALWGLFKVAVELRQQPFVFWITDLSRPDVIFNLPFKLPIFGIDQVSGLAILMGIATFIQQKMSIKDPKQQALIYVMPVMLTLMFMGFPSGLNLYYFMFNVFSIGQQYYINHKHDDTELKPVKNPNKKKGFMSKLMEAAEQNAKTQQQRKKR
jgi:YidC/Oxa1 family membrane protein insertase